MTTILKEAGDNVSRQAAILEAGFEIFSEKGFGAARLDDVAQRAGVAKGTLYIYFDSKEALFKKVVLQTLSINLAPLEKKLEDHQGPVIDFLEVVFNQLGTIMSETRVGAFPKTIIAEANAFPELAKFYAENVILRVQVFFTHIIEMGIARGEFRKVDPEPSARILMAPFLMLALFSQTPVIRDGIGLDAKEHIKAAREILFGGLKA